MSDAPRTQVYRDLLERAGVLPSETYMDPVLGLCISASGVRKIAALSTNQHGYRRLMNHIAKARRSLIKVVPDDK